MELKAIDKEHFSAEDFVGCLLKEGIKCPCDETVDSFYENRNLPPFYDEDLYKRGQKFFNENIFALLYSKFLGLLSILAIPSVVRMLLYTKKTGSPLAAYKRYLSTVFHMCIWYQSDFTPGSKLWQSVLDVRKKHNFVSKTCFSAGLGRISQKDMALTQFGFMGFAALRREKVGLHNVKEEDLRAFVHVWKVIGYIMGIEDRFNICRDSLEETTEICRVLAEKLLKPAIEKKDKDFIAIATYLSDGMWSMNPTLNVKIYLNIVQMFLQSSNNTDLENQDALFELNFLQNVLLHIVLFMIWSLKFNISKIFCNYIQYITLWLMKVCPFLAYYQFGYSNSHIVVL